MTTSTIDSATADFLDELCALEDTTSVSSKSSHSTARIVRIPKELDILPPRPRIFPQLFERNDGGRSGAKGCCWMNCGSGNKNTPTTPSTEKDDIEQYSTTSVTSFTSRDDEHHDNGDDLISIFDMTEVSDDNNSTASTPRSRALLNRNRPLLENASELVLGVCQLLLSMWMANNVFENALKKKNKKSKR